QGLVEVEHLAPRHERLGYLPEVLFHRVALEVAVANEDAEQHARDVGIENRGSFAKREAANRACRVRADAFERQQCLFVGGPAYRPPASRAMVCSRFGGML